MRALQQLCGRRDGEPFIRCAERACREGVDSYLDVNRPHLLRLAAALEQEAWHFAALASRAKTVAADTT